MPNKKRNAFYFFMKEKQEEYNRKGDNINIKRMADIAHPLWQKLSLNERKKYEDMAKTNKLEYNAVGRLASDGTSVLENLQEEERKEDLEKQMRQGITNLLRVPGEEKEFIEINSQRKFHFITFNILCFVEGGTFIPNEVGAAEYSIKDGITKTYHKFIHTGPIPKGYTGEAKRHSEDTHQIPITGLEGESTNDYWMVWNELMDFINPPMNHSDIFPPLFCLKEATNQTLGSLKWLAVQVGEIAPDDDLDLKVWDAGYLLMELRCGAGSATASYAIAAESLKKNNFDYIPNTRCMFHEDLDSSYCALGHSRRICYLLSDAICGLFGVEVTERHLPLRAMADKPYEVYIPSVQSISLRSSNERGMGRGVPKVQSNMSSRPGSSVSDRSRSSLSERTDSRLHERIEPNRYVGSSSISSFDEPKSPGNISWSDSENSPPGSTVGNVQKAPAATSGMSSNIQLRQPGSTCIALSLARAAQAPAIAPGKGIGRGQRKLP